MRTCQSCGKNKDDLAFYDPEKTNVRKCRECFRAHGKAYRKRIKRDDPEKCSKTRSYMRNYMKNYVKNNKGHFNKWIRKSAKKRRDKAVNLLGGCCQLCGTIFSLELCHINYTQPRKKSVVNECLTNPANFLLLCKECHHHPERWLKELIMIKNIK